VDRRVKGDRLGSERNARKDGLSIGGRNIEAEAPVKMGAAHAYGMMGP